MNKEQKAALVDEIAEQLQDAEAIFAVDYRGISVPQAAELRARLRDADATFRIVKNRLTLRAAEKAGTDALQELLEGPTALTLVRGDAALAAKALNEFARAGDFLEFKGGLLEGQTLSVDEIKSIARLPARDVLHAQVVGVVASPLTGLVRGLNGLVAGLAVQLRQIEEQGLVSGAAEEAPAEQAPTQEASSAEEAPAEEVPTQEASSAEEAPAEEVPTQEASSAEAPAEGASAQESSAEEASAEDTPTEGGEDPVEAGDTGSSAAGPEGEHPEEPAEGADEAAPDAGDEQETEQQADAPADADEGAAEA